MRTRLVGLLLSLVCIAPLALAGCSDGSSPSDSSVVQDLAVVGTCVDILTCARPCLTAACSQACAAAGAAAARADFTALYSCATTYCNTTSDAFDLGVGDGGATCTGESDTSASCAACVNEAASAKCATQLATCISS